MEKVVLKIPTIKCEGCVENIQRVLTQKKGIISVAGDPDSKQVTVSYFGEEITHEEIHGAVVQMGHEIA